MTQQSEFMAQKKQLKMTVRTAKREKQDPKSERLEMTLPLVRKTMFLCKLRNDKPMTKPG